MASILVEGGTDAESWRKRLLDRMHNVSAFMKTVKQRFSVWYNKSHQRYGTLWADRFKSVLVEAEVRALAGMRAIYGERKPLRDTLIADYRMVLFGKGAMAETNRGKIDRAEALKVIENGGKVPRSHALRCRVRHFTDGSVLGSREFVQSWFDAHRDRFDTQRKLAPRPMGGADGGDLTVSRGLRQAVFR